MAEVAAKLGKSPAQVLIRWAIQRGCSVLPKSSNPQRIAANLEVFDWAIPEEEVARLNALPVPHTRVVDGSFFLNPAGPYCTLQQLWDE